MASPQEADPFLNSDNCQVNRDATIFCLDRLDIHQGTARAGSIIDKLNASRILNDLKSREKPVVTHLALQRAHEWYADLEEIQGITVYYEEDWT